MKYFDKLTNIVDWSNEKTCLHTCKQRKQMLQVIHDNHATIYL